MSFELRPAGAADLDAILAIYNHAVLHTTASYDYQPRSSEKQAAWFAAKQAAGHPVLVALHLMVGAIDAANTGSIELHRRLGFEEAGVLREAGYKFEHWLDLLFMTKRLDDRGSRLSPG